MRLIDADALREAMYHEAFETDTPLQKWDSGCWIRYKMFEKCIDDAPEFIQCKDCKFYCKGEDFPCGISSDILVEDNDYCSFAERKEK